MASTRVFLKCGCVAHAERILADGLRVPSCIVHDCDEPAPMPNIEGRKAKCVYGGAEVPSSFDLAFFEYKPSENFDRYYCGCYGWD